MLSSIVSYLPRGPRLLSSRAIVQGGPVGDGRSFRMLLSEHDTWARRFALSCEIRNVGSCQSMNELLASGYRWEDHTDYVVDLAHGEEAVLAGMTRTRRRSVAKAERTGLNLVEIGVGGLGFVYDILTETYRRAAVPLSDRSFFEAAFETFLPAGELWARGAELDGSLCALRLVLAWKDVLYDWYAGSTDQGREHRADEWLVWQVLREGVARGFKTYDFGGAGRPGEFYGPGEFKRQFGGKATNPGRFHKTYHPLALRASAVGYQLWRRAS